MPEVAITGRATENTDIGAPVQMEVTLTNPTGADILCRVISIQGDGFFQTQDISIDGVLAAFQSRTIAVVVKTVAGVGPSSFRGHCSMRLNDGLHVAIAIPWNLMTRSLLQQRRRDRRPLNILFWGVAGAGKSSLIDKVRTLFAASSVPSALVPSGHGRGHVTVQMRGYAIVEAGLNLIDMWGLDYENYTNEELELTLEGCWSPAWNMSATPSMADIQQPRRNASTRRCFVCPRQTSLGRLPSRRS